MNHDIPPFDDPASEREWQAQERAMRAERLGLDANRDDARVLRYRLITRALRQPPVEALPADFAQQVASLATRTRKLAEPPGESRRDATWLAVAAGSFSAAGAATVVLYPQAWQLAWPTPAPQTLHWSLLLGGCLGLSWLLGRLKPRAAAHH
jgi:hypothetical protein